MSRNKGGVGEREVVAIAHAHGLTAARRNFMSGGQGGGDIIGVPGVHLEVKRQERCSIWEWIKQARDEAPPADTPVVAFRRNGDGWYAAVPLDDFLELVAARATS
jgi:Holliday junction resolvase